jgi:hypothetical protein
MNQFDQQLRAMQQAAERDFQTAAHVLIAYFVALGLYVLFIALTGVHCATRGPEKNNASWMMLTLFMPVIGPLCYWIFRPSRPDDFSTVSAGVFPAPPPPTSRSIADSITDDLSQRKRQK